MEEIEEEGVMQVSGDGDHGGGDQGGGGEVVQVIMQDDGNIIMPEGQFIQVNTDDGQPQFIQVTDNNGENQLIQLMPDGQAHLVQVQEGPDGNTHIIQVAPASMDLGGDQGGMTIVNMGDAPPSDINQENEQTEQHMHLQVSGLDGESGQDVMGSVILNPDGETTLHHETSDMSAEQEEQQQHIVIDHHTQSTEDTEDVADNQEYHTVSHRPRQTIITIHPKMNQHDDPSPVNVSQSADETTQGIMTSVAGTTMSEMDSVEDSPPQVAKARSSITTRVVAGPASHTVSSSDTNSGGGINIKPKVKRLDMTSPIPLTTETIVVVNGKRCVLRVDPQSSNLVAYPFTPTPVPGKRGRGRPRKVRPPEGVTPKFLPLLSPGGSQKSMASQDSESSQSASELSFDTPTGTPTKKDGLSEQENSAAEGLLGLSEDGVRRSRRKRKRATFLSDYEMGAVEGVVDDDDDEDDSKEGILEGVKRPRGRPPAASPKPPVPAPNNAMQTLLMNMGFIPKKRGRGRPRRNPLPTAVPTNTGGIPTFIIQQPGGNAVMMSPMQTIEGFQKNLVTIRAKPAPPELVLEKAQTPASIVIQNADGTETQIDTAPPEAALQTPEEVGDVEGPIITEIEGSVQPTEGDEMEAEEALKADNQEQEKEIMSKPVTDMLDSGALDDDVADPDYEPGGPIEEEDDEELVDKDSPEQKKRKLSESSPMPQPTIIQLPDNMVPLMIPKKTPVKIGLKATESDLEKLKCPKCEFQAYYQQQFQEHIATHIDDINKCKCCNYLTFEKDGLLGHFRDAHPKCICPVCDFMAEHAYIIKRHMMRHSANGCECNLCGKRYKDQYILKMHLKMVHMPAEVLYECQVCTKKFTRKAHLKRHLRIHEPEKPFKCSHCDYRGCERSDITKHLLIHEEPRHVCEVCGKAFRHIKNKELHVKRHKGQRDYKCGVCDFYGYTFTDIRKHIERKHTDNRNILCDKCGSAFKNDILLREHQKQQCELLMFEASLPVEEEVTEGDGQTIHHTIHVPHDQYVVDQGQVGDPHQQQQQHIMVNGNQVNITVEQLDHLEGLSHHHHHQHQEQLTGGEVTVVHMDDIQGAGDEELEEEELLEEEEQLEQEELEEDLTIEEVQEEEVAVAGIVSSMAEDVHIITVSPEDQGLVVEMGEEDMGQVVYEQQVIEQEVIEQQVMEHHEMNQQQMDEEAIGEQLLIELVQ